MIGDARPSADPRTDFVDGRAPRPQEPPDDERPIVKLPPGREDQHLELDRKRKDTPRKGLLRRHPFAFVVGLPLFILAAAGGSLYWDYAEHFETTVRRLHRGAAVRHRPEGARLYHRRARDR